MMGWHSASWSRGKEPRSGGEGLENFWAPPGLPKVDISMRGTEIGTMMVLLEDDDLIHVGEHVKTDRPVHSHTAPQFAELQRPTTLNNFEVDIDVVSSPRLASSASDHTRNPHSAASIVGAIDR